MNNEIKIGRELCLCAALVLLIVLARWCLADIPNFQPVAAVALFAGFLFHHRWLAVLAACLGLAISDGWLGGYHPALAVFVYAGLVFPVVLGFWLSRRPKKHTTSLIFGWAGMVLTGSCFFFAVSNWAFWQFSGLYPLNLSGLGHCYAQAIPFFKYTLLGDFTFAAALFGGYTVTQAIGKALPQAAAALADA